MAKMPAPTAVSRINESGRIKMRFIRAVRKTPSAPSASTSVVKIEQTEMARVEMTSPSSVPGFTLALSMAFSSGLPLEEGVSLAASLLKDCPDAVKRCETCRACLDAGGDLSTALGESHMLTASDCRMLTLGMRAGTGDAAMERISHRLSEEAREALENQVAKVEPALVLITSILVGAILFSVMLPLMHIMKAIG